MNSKETQVRVESIRRRQNSGKITAEQAATEFDMLLMQGQPDGLVIYGSDSTGLTAEWDANVMLFPKPFGMEPEREPSNTGIYVKGPNRGFLITRPAGAAPDCAPEVLEHFLPRSKGWLGARAS